MNLFKKYLEVIQESDTKVSLKEICTKFFTGLSSGEEMTSIVSISVPIKLEDGNGVRTLFLHEKAIARYFTTESEIEIEPDCPDEIKKEIGNIFNRMGTYFTNRTNITR
jgi:hypothetical protein